MWSRETTFKFNVYTFTVPEYNRRFCKLVFFVQKCSRESGDDHVIELVMAAGGDDVWERSVMKKLPQLVKALRPSLLLDHLRASELLASEEYRRLQAMTTEEERSRELLHNYLPTKGKTAYSKFCNVLSEVEGQTHVLTEILQERSRPRPAKRKLSPQRSSVDFRQTRSRAAKISKPSDKRATFVFKSEYEAIVKPRENALRKVCQNLFGTDPNEVKFVYGGSGNIEDSRPCHCDAEVKLLSLVIYGVAAEKVREMRDHLIDCVMTFLRKEKVVVDRNDVEFLEAAESSAFVVLRMPFSVYFPLLCIFAEPGKEHQFGSILQTLFPDMTKAMLCVGGLPFILLQGERPSQTTSAGMEVSELPSEQKTASDYEQSLTTSQHTTKVVAGFKLERSDHHRERFEMLPPIARDIAISQLPEEVRLSLTRISDNSTAKNETCQRYLIDHFPDYFDTEPKRLNFDQRQTGFMDDLIRFLGMTVNGSIEDLYAVLHDLRCTDACHVLQKYVTGTTTLCVVSMWICCTN